FLGSRSCPEPLRGSARHERLAESRPCRLYQLNLLPKIKSCPPQDCSDLTIVKPGGVVLHAYGALLVVELDLADAVDFPSVVQGHHLFLSGRRSVFEDHVEQGHFCLLVRRFEWFYRKAVDFKFKI